MDGQYAEVPLGRRGGPGCRAGITFAAAGDMDLVRRRELPCRDRLMERIGAPSCRLRSVRQVHSRTVVRIDGSEPWDGPFPDADGVATDRSDLILSVTVADCLPIYILDRRTGAFAIAHSGWKGTGIVSEAIALMASWFGSRPGELAVTLGPGIGPCCYHVPLERAQCFRSDFGDRSVRFAPRDGASIDLREANLGLLEREGVEDVAVIADCTACNPALGSFRRQGARSFTRMLAFIGGW